MILAWLLLLTGLTISAVAIYYSVVGLAAIFSAAVIPIIVMGSALEVAKLVCASWLKANWSNAPRLMKIYMTTAVAVLMLITSMGIFGFLSKAHSDQSLVSGDVVAKISIYDEKIKTEKDNIDANRKALKQLDEAVDQVMARSQDEKGADKAVAIRRAQQKDRSRLSQEITESQKRISALNDERAPIAAEVRKVEAEVGPLKYIAAFVYGATDESVLERAVTWVIITIIIVFDPLAVIMLLAAQMTFGWKKEQEENEFLLHDTVPVYVTDVGEPPTAKELAEIEAEGDSPAGSSELQTPEQPTVTDLEQINHELAQAAADLAESNIPVYEEVKTTSLADVLAQPTTIPEHSVQVTSPVSTTTMLSDVQPASELDSWNKMIEEAERAVEEEKKFAAGEIQELAPETVAKLEDELSVDIDELARRIDEEQDRIERDKQLLRKVRSNETLEDEDSKKKSYMTKDEEGRIVTKNRP